VRRWTLPPASYWLAMIIYGIHIPPPRITISDLAKAEQRLTVGTCNPFCFPPIFSTPPNVGRLQLVKMAVFFFLSRKLVPFCALSLGIPVCFVLGLFTSRTENGLNEIILISMTLVFKYQASFVETTNFTYFVQCIQSDTVLG